MLALQGKADALGNRGGFVQVGGRKHHHKLVPAHACQDIVLPQTGLEGMGGCPQDLIAHLVPMGIVDLFEVIDIDCQD